MIVSESWNFSDFFELFEFVKPHYSREIPSILAEKILVFERAHATRETEGSISESADYTDKGILTERVDIREHVSVRDKVSWNNI